jgi:hypothetical protein
MRVVVARARLIPLLVLAASAFTRPAAAERDGRPSASFDIKLTGNVTSSITLRVIEGGATAAGHLVSIAPELADVDARRVAGGAVVNAEFTVELRQTGVSCANVFARLDPDSTDRDVTLALGGEPARPLLDGNQLFAVVREARATLSGVLSVVLSDRREPGPVRVNALLEATECGELPS